MLLLLQTASGHPALSPVGAHSASTLDVLYALLAAAILAALVWRVHAATPLGAVTGGLLMLCFALTPAGPRSSAWPLTLMLLLTLAATRVTSRTRKPLSQHDARERTHGRSAAQVAANLGVAALSGALAGAHGQLAALTVLLAALSEAAADTLASELGQALRQLPGGTPRLITTLRKVPPGTDGGITPAGTLLGAAGAILVGAVGVSVLALPWSAGRIAAGAGIAGLLFDSLLGATLERAGWLHNDAVNFLSTLFAAAVALALG